MNLKKILQEIGKGLLSILIGGILGAVASILYGFNFWLPERIASLDPGLGTLFGALALILLTVILFGILGMILGAIWGMIIFQTIKLIGRLKKKR